ncbi:N-acetylglucosamine-6-phosphate deacetylase [Desulfovibrio sp. OttesenSCG-928-G15]|nr:N-acetylglucosamine-6-phosphate deacetylase [Desulfovibrio sp. OttesenSCG-928-G15]
MRKPDSLPVHYALTGGLVFDGDNFLPGHAVEIRAERIGEVLREELLGQDIRKVPVDGAVIAPGFVDLQLNGASGVMLLPGNITVQTLDTMHAGNLKSGCTSFLPTLVSSPDADMEAAMALVQNYRQERGAASVLGLHLEGPYISKERRGIHNEAFVRPLSPAARERLAAFASHTPLMLTLAPECVDEGDIRVLSEAGVVVSLGHSAASYEQAKRAVRSGARLATHLFNGMSPWQGREPGLVGAAFDSPDLACGMIADGRHVHFASLAMAKRLKGRKCFLVTDGTAASGSDIAQFDFSGETVYVKDGACVSAQGTLGGSNLTMIEAVRNMIGHVGIAPDETLRMASLYPAAVMGQERLVGRIATGLYANLAVFSPFAYAMVATVDRGTLHVW